MTRLTDAVARAEMLWANLPTGNKPWTSLPTHEKALVCYTLARFEREAITSRLSSAGDDELVATDTAIHLRRSGDHAIVSIILSDGREVDLIREHVEGSFSHIIEPSGIARAVKESR